MIGWRGEPGTKDAYQHQKMGPITIPLLKLLEIPHDIIPEDTNTLYNILQKANNHMKTQNRPYALIIRKNIFETGEDNKETNNN